MLKAIGGLARGPGAERYQNIGSHADPNLASESACLGTPEEIIARLKKLEAGGVDPCCWSIRPARKRRCARSPRRSCQHSPTLPRARAQAAANEPMTQGGRQWTHRLAGASP